MKARSKVKAQEVRRNPNAINVVAKSEGQREAALADAILKPTLQGAATVKAYKSYSDGEDGDGVDLSALVAELQKQAEATSDGDLRRPEAMLVAQAHSLDAIFGNLARRAVVQQYLPNCETILRLALKAQSQCRATLETLAMMKNPPQLALVRQANIAHGAQQVNNAPHPLRARETKNRQNKLLEQTHGQRLDSSTTRTAGTANTQLAPVAKIDRPKNGSR